jgi:hypothetical protein
LLTPSRQVIRQKPEGKKGEQLHFILAGNGADFIPNTHWLTRGKRGAHVRQLVQSSALVRLLCSTSSRSFIGQHEFFYSSPEGQLISELITAKQF